MIKKLIGKLKRIRFYRGYIRIRIPFPRFYIEREPDPKFDWMNRFDEEPLAEWEKELRAEFFRTRADDE